MGFRSPWALYRHRALRDRSDLGLDAVKVGDLVNITYTQAVAVSVEEAPKAYRELADGGGALPLADALARRGDLLDALIDASAFDLPGCVDDLVAEFSAGEAGDDYERLLDRVRRKVGEKRFGLGVQLIEAASDPLVIAAANARVAEAALQCGFSNNWADDLRCQYSLPLALSSSS